MNFIFAKLYEEYQRNNDPAKFNITFYISIVYFFFLFAFILPAMTFIARKHFDDKIGYEKSTILTVTFGLFAAIIYSVYFIYIRRNYIGELTKKYKGKKINRTILYLIVVMTPLIFLIIAATTTVYLNGGEILGHKIQGLVE